MLDNYQLDNTIRVALINLMVVLYDCGITEIHMGGIMRILGIPNETAALHDNEHLLLDDDFVKYVEQLHEPRPVGQPLH